MRRTLLAFLPLFLLSNLGLAAEPSPASPRLGRWQEESHPWCGTSEANSRQVEHLAAWVKAKQEADRARGRIRAQAAGDARYDRGVFLVERDSSMAPFDQPLDLDNSSLLFTPVSASAFTVQKTALAYDTDVGGLLRSFDYNGGSQAYHINNFAFPFYGSSVRDIHIAATKGIFLSAPPASAFRQFSALEAVTQRVPVIAPLLFTTDSYGTAGRYDVYSKETASALTITWRTGFVFEYEEDIQVTLFSNGNIRFSYRKTVNVAWGAVMVTSGQEPWYSVLTPVFTGSDPIGDATPDPAIPAGLLSMLDIENLVVRRVSNSNLIEFEITVQTAINRGAIPPGASLDFYIEPGGTSTERNANSIYISIEASDIYYRPPGWSGAWNSSAASTAGRTITARVTDELLAIATFPTTVDVYALYWDGSSYPTADFFTNPTLAILAPATNLSADLSTTTAPLVVTGKPIIEAFTLPVINVGGVWDRLKTVFGLTDTEIDQVAIYQTFYTDLIFYAGGFSTGGNPQADGIAPPGFGRSTTSAKRPALMHLDKLGRGWNDTPNGILHIQTHEFGHRWLYFIQIREGTVSTNNLNPDRGHPKQGVHIPAAFSVITPTDASAMGGGIFTQTGTNTYRTPVDFPNWGYSWHELYLMGLASAAEVTEPWYYLNASDLEGPYYPRSDYEYTVTSRTNVVQQQIIDALGSRNPAYGATQTAFKEIFVVLQRPGALLPTTDVEQFSNDFRAAFKRHFAAVTGARASVITTPDSILPAAEFSFMPAAPTVGATITFADLSYGDPVSWSWNFGDSTSSNQQNPTKSYPTAGQRTVTLTVSKPSGSHSVSKTVTVGGIVLLRGDANGDSTRTVTDVVYLLNAFFGGGPQPTTVFAGDANSDGAVSVLDVFFLINHLFSGGPAPAA